MRYDIFSPEAPRMPRLQKGTSSIRLLLSQASPDMRESLAPMLFPILGAHISGAQFLYPDGKWLETSGMMANLVADSGAGKGQLTNIVEALCRSFRESDKETMRRIEEWKQQVKTRSANKDKPQRPAKPLRFPPADCTHAAFIQNAADLEEAGNLTQYFNMPEIEMLYSLSSRKGITMLLRNIYDCARGGGQLRATEFGISANPQLRTNITVSSTPGTTRLFFKGHLLNGTFGRMVFSLRARSEPNGRIPRQGDYGPRYLDEVDRIISLLSQCKGKFNIQPLNTLIRKLSNDMADLSALTDDTTLHDIAKRSLVSAWKAGCILWVMNGSEWSLGLTNFVEWLVYRDLWSKTRLFADLLHKVQLEADLQASKKGPQNMLRHLPETFSQSDLEALRTTLEKSPQGTADQLRKWVKRGFITRNEQTGQYTKVK